MDFLVEQNKILVNINLMDMSPDVRKWSLLFFLPVCAATEHGLYTWVKVPKNLGFSYTNTLGKNLPNTECSINTEHFHPYV